MFSPTAYYVYSHMLLALITVPIKGFISCQSNKKVIGYSNNSHTAIAPTGIPFHVSHHCSLQYGGYFSLLVVSLAPFSTMRANQ